MTAKHSPATPLPLVLVRNVRDTTRDAVRIDDANGMSVAHIDIRKGDHAGAQQFGRYIVHAANAYPKLVEALRETLRDRLTQANLHQLPPGIRQRLEHARALLLSLEEAE